MTTSKSTVHYEVIVGNIGKVFEGHNGFDAYVVFNTYVGKSKRGEGRVAGESVALWLNNEPVKEFYGAQVNGEKV